MDFLPGSAKSYNVYLKFTVEVKYCTSVACVEKPTPDKPVGNMSVNLTSFITLFFADNIDSVASDKEAPTFTAVPSLPANLLTPDSSLPCVGNLSLPASITVSYTHLTLPTTPYV